MEIAKISSKGQITIPVSVRNRLHLNTGDKVLILEENGRFYIENAANVAFQHVEEGFRGAAAEAGFKKRGRNAGLYERNPGRTQEEITNESYAGYKYSGFPYLFPICGYP